MAATWTVYALLKSSSGDGKEWKVQINEEGQFRCNCPSYIFSKVMPKTCKHCRRCEQQRQVEAVQVVALSSPGLAEAERIFDAMCAAAHTKTRVNTKALLGPDAGRAMVTVLAEKLAAWVPSAAAPVAVEVGVRRITFDD